MAGKKYALETHVGVCDCLNATPTFATTLSKAIIIEALLCSTKRDFGPDGKKLQTKVAFHVFRDSFYMVSRASLQAIAVTYLPSRICNKLMKDLSASALRKLAKSGSRFTTAKLMIPTALKGLVLPNLAILIVEEFLLGYRLFMKAKCSGIDPAIDFPQDDRDGIVQGIDSKQQFLQVTKNKIVKTGGAIVIGALCTSIGSYIKPGFGTVVGWLVSTVIIEI